MRVYAFYDSSPSAHPEQAEFLRLWALSWERRGFTPKLLTARHAARSSLFRHFANWVSAGLVRADDAAYLQWFALHAVRGCGWLTSPRVMNFSFPSRRVGHSKKKMYVNAFTWPAFRVPGRSVTLSLTRMLLTSKWTVATDPFPAGLKEFSCAADVLNSGRLM